MNSNIWLMLIFLTVVISVVIKLISKIKFRNWILLLIFNWKKLKLNEKIRLDLDPIFRSNIRIRRSRVHTQVQAYRASFEPKICTPCVHTQERALLLVILPIIRCTIIFIHLLTNITFPYGISLFHYNFLSQWVYFEQQFLIHP